MVQVYNAPLAGIPVTVGSPITLNSEKEQTGCTAVANVPATEIDLNRAGFYMVHFNAVVASGSGAAGDVGVQMFVDGVADPASKTSASSSGSTDLVSVSFTTLVRVLPSCKCSINRKRLSFRVTGTTALVNFANVVVTKLS